MTDIITQRPSFHKLFMDTCIMWAQRSTCQRIQTAALLVKNNNIISIGYNGVPRHIRHCTEFWNDFFDCIKGHSNPDDELRETYNDMVKDLNFTIDLVAKIDTYQDFIESECFRILHHYWSDKNELHAELNAILQANGSIQGTTLYTLYSPCRQCAKSIISAKISKVVYSELYIRDSDGIKLLEKNKIIVEAYKN